MYKFDPASNKFVYRPSDDADIDTMVMQRLIEIESTIGVKRTIKLLNRMRIGCGVVALLTALLLGWAVCFTIAQNHVTVWTGINAICFVVNGVNAWRCLWRNRASR